VTPILAAKDISRFKRVITQRLGLQFADDRSGFLGEVLGRRLAVSHGSGAAYLAALEHEWPAEEAHELAQELTVGETYFFRNMDQFRAFAQVALPERYAHRGQREGVSLLSAGCASGEEAYSMAIMAHEAGADVGRNVSVRAVDVNPAAIQKARRARYTRWALRETPPDLESRWFRQDGDALVMDDMARAAVRFEERNLAIDDLALWQPNAYDVVFCRNVFMYFDAMHAESLVERIARSLAPGGYLFLGHAETLRGVSQRFHLCHTHDAFYYQRKESAIGVTSGDAQDRWSPAVASPVHATVLAGTDRWVATVHTVAERIGVHAQDTNPSDRPVAPGRYPWDLGPVVSLLQSERFAEALAVVQAFPPESTLDVGVLLLHSVLLVQGAQLRDAEATCTQLLAIDELNAGAHYVLALCREGAGDHAGARDRDRMAAYLDPAFAMPRLHLGLMARRNGDYLPARRELEQALVLLRREDAARLLMFGGGFGREALVALCHAEIAACGATT
jgi:chemotaxis protein methyltransferase CheR